MSFAKLAYHLLSMFGIDPIKTWNAVRGAAFFPGNLISYLQQRGSQPDYGRDFAFALYPCVDDRFSQSGAAKGHYFHQDLLVARRIFKAQPEKHVDVGSRVDGFIAHVASFRPIDVLDIRPLQNTIPNVNFIQADFMNPVDRKLVDYCDPLSCLHALEHFGLGRYGDPIKIDGHKMGLDNLHSVLKTGGKLYLSVPIGPQRVEFDAHRVFAVASLLKMVASRFRVDRFSFVDDRGDLHEDVAIDESKVAANYGCHYGCGILELTKL